MKNLLLLVVLTISLQAFSQNLGDQLVSETIKQLNIEETKLNYSLITFRDFGSESLLVFPVLSEKEEGFMIFDAYLVLVENKTGLILSKYFGEQDWYSDAVSLSGITIEPKVFELKTGTVAYGITIDYHGQSRPNPYSATEFSLYVKEKEQLVPVLEAYRTAYKTGETDTRCKGEFQSHSKSLEIKDSNNNIYSDLLFTDSIEKTISTDQNCERRVVDKFQEVEILQFRDGTYK